MDDAVSLVEQRHEFLRALAEDSRSKPEVVEATPYARSTVDRALDELVAADLVERAGACYRATPAGVRMLEAYDRFHETAGLYYAARDAIAGVDHDEPFPPEILEGAAVETATPDMPTGPVVRGFQETEDLDRMRTTCPVMFDVYDRYMYEHVVEMAADVEVVFTPAVLETIEREYAERWRAAVDTGRVTAYVCEDLPSFAFYLQDGLPSAEGGSELGVTVHDDRGLHTIKNDSPAALEWGRERWASLVEAAELVYSPTDRASSE